MKDTYCTFPFKQVAVKKIKRGKIIQYAPCCHIKPSARLQMPNDDPTPDELFNSPEMKQLRSDLLAGVKNPILEIANGNLIVDKDVQFLKLLTAFRP